MKPLNRWIAPCLVASLYFADFTSVKAETPANGRKPVQRQVARPAPAQRPAPAARPAPKPKAAPQQRAASQPQRQAAPQRKAAPAAPKIAQQQRQAAPAPAPKKPAQPARQAPAQQPQVAQRQQQQAKQAQQAAQNKQRVTENQEAARQAQAARQQVAQDNARKAAQERASRAADNAEKAKAAQNDARQAQAAKREQVTDAQERQRQALQDRQQDAQQRAQDARERAQQNQADRRDQAAGVQERQRQAIQDRQQDAQQRAQDARERAQQNQADRRDQAAGVQERQRQAIQDRQQDAQQRAQDARERAQQNQADRRDQAADNLERQRQAMQDRAAANQDRIQDNQARLRDAQDRARQAQANLRDRVSDNVEQRREAYLNARQLAAEARRPMLERPISNFRPEFGGVERRNTWGSQWGTWGAWNRANAVANAREANRLALASNYQRAVNWSYRPNYWGSRPWWTSNVNHNWYTGSWNYGWDRGWYNRHRWYAPAAYAYPGYVVRDNGIGNGLAWGLAAWGLGSLIYDSGYETYYNPYRTRYVYGDTSIDYSTPFTTIAANYPTGDEDEAKTAAEKSSAAFERSRQSFRDEDYMTALKSVDEAISYVPGDSSLHEYRALVLFSLGRYGDSAAVLNSVLASGPGWDYNTMVGFYADPKVYDGQLVRLEDYTHSRSNEADGAFVLGYHYMVAGNLEGAGTEFDRVVQLQPRDTVAKQLRDLVRSSVKDPQAQQNSEPIEGDDRVERDMIEPSRLIGTWSTSRGDAGTVTMTLQDNNQFRWVFDRDSGKDTEMDGTYSIDDRGLLVLKSDDSQMVGEIHMPDDGKLQFVLAGGPEGDPGLNFSRH